MSERFLITGLPRSRTAWFSLVCNCPHEPISRMGYKRFRPLWADGTGVSDAGASLYLKEILADFAPRTLIIDRDMGEVMSSFLAYVSPLKIDTSALAKQLWSMRRYLAGIESPLIKRVMYEDLNDLDVMKSCLAWLGVNPSNLLDLMHFRIESDLSWNLAQIKKAAG